MTDKLKVLDLFSGIGGFSLGLERTGGFETVAFCENADFPRRVLAKHWPEVECFHDVSTSDFSTIGPVDLVTGGFPCQDISLAGHGAGLTGERSGLFWQILRAVRMVGQPQLLLENVAALLDRGMGTVLGSLSQIGYDSEWHCIPARYVGAPHGRDRLWIIADSNGGKRWEEPYCGSIGRMGGQQQSFPWDTDWQSSLARFRGLDDGLPRSVASTDGYRNAVVPQIPEMIGNAILAHPMTPERGTAA
jgi:DNA (cytosine-5)-methyltransferase 1